VLYARVGQPGISAWRLVLVTVMQFMEGLSDSQAAEAVRSRIDWKYALGLALEDSGFEASVLSEFRDRLLEHDAPQYLLELMLSRFKSLGLVKGRGRQRTDSTHVLAAVRALNRTELVGETLRVVLNDLAVVVPEWLRAQVPSDWYERYGRRIEDWRLPKSEEDRRVWAEQVGRDGQYLLACIDSRPEMAWLQDLPALRTVRQVWDEQYHLSAEGVRWRRAGELLHPGERIESPYDPQAHYGVKREGCSWTGYRVHLTETCDTDSPHLVTHVETTLANVQDLNVVPTVHTALDKLDLLPAEHLVDTAYVSAEVIRQARLDHGVAIVGLMHPDTSWQAQTEGGFDLTRFTIDWSAQTVTCPAGQTSIKWSETHDRFDDPTIHVAFAVKDCTPCPLRAACTRGPARHLSLHPQPLQQTLLAARTRQQTPEFKTLYRLRADIEGTHSQAIRVFELRRTRYLGLAKTHLQHIFTAMALNLCRVTDWWAAHKLAQTRVSPFAALAT
jgi:transposase